MAFLLAAIIEAFVTGQPWPTGLRVGIGVLTFTAFWGWTTAFALMHTPTATTTTVTTTTATSAAPRSGSFVA